MSIPVYYLHAVPARYVMLVPGCGIVPLTARAHVCGSGTLGQANNIHLFDSKLKDLRANIWHHVFEMSPTEKTTIDTLVAELPVWLKMLENFLTDVEAWNHAEEIWDVIKTSHVWDYNPHFQANHLFWNEIQNNPAYNWSQSMQNIMTICTKLLLSAKTQNLKLQPIIFFPSEEEYVAARKAGQASRWAYVQKSVEILNTVRTKIVEISESQIQHVESDNEHNLPLHQACRNLHRHFLHRFQKFCDAFFIILIKLQENEDNWPDCVDTMQSECSYASTTRIGAVKSLPVAIEELQELQYKT